MVGGSALAVVRFIDRHGIINTLAWPKGKEERESVVVVLQCNDMANKARPDFNNNCNLLYSLLCSSSMALFLSLFLYCTVVLSSSSDCPFTVSIHDVYYTIL